LEAVRTEEVPVLVVFSQVLEARKVVRERVELLPKVLEVA
jgi:hypothetical protein